MSKFFKKPSGIVIEALPNHDIDSLKSRFIECDKDGKEIKKEVKKEVKKTKKAGK